MNTVFLKGLGAVATTGTIATGGFIAWRHSSKPTDVRNRLVREGLIVADVNKKGVWGAIYLVKKDVSGFSDFVDSSSKDTASSQLKQKCSSLLQVSVSDESYEESYEKAKRWCLNPEIGTIEIQFELEEREFASGDDDFKNLFVLYKGTSSFVEAIKTVESGFDVGAGLDDVKEKVKNWCNSMKSKSPKGVDLENAISWCTKPDSNFKSFMERKGFRFLGGEEWASKFSDLKNKKDVNLETEVGAEDSDGSKLKSWCEGKNIGGVQIHTLSNDISKIEARCFISK